MKCRLSLRQRRCLLYLSDSPMTIREIVDLERKMFGNLIQTKLNDRERIRHYEHYLYWKAVYKLRQFNLVWKLGRNYFLTKEGEQLVRRWLSENKILLLEELTPIQVQNNKESDDGCPQLISQK